MLKFDIIFERSTYLIRMLNKHISRIFSNRNLFFYSLYWILYLLFFTTQRFFALRMDIGELGLAEKPSLIMLKESFYANLVFLPLVILATHFIVDYILPKYYFRRKFYHFSVILISSISIYPFFVYLLRKLVLEPFVLKALMEYSWYNYFMALLIYVFGMVPLVWFKMAAHLREDAIFHQKLDNDRLKALLKLKETELKLLKSQIHPHFLFNTLNNLYSLALEKSDRTPDLIIRLADMLSYIIYDGSSEKVPLTKEIEFIKSYIELQKVRYESCDITFKVEGDINAGLIAPMILHTFIDNSFKHGADKDSGNPWIRISLSVKNHSLILNVVNSINKNSKNENKITGIGISNTLKRLELLYLGRHELNIDKSDDKYSVSLRIDL